VVSHSKPASHTFRTGWRGAPLRCVAYANASGNYTALFLGHPGDCIKTFWNMHHERDAEGGLNGVRKSTFYGVPPRPSVCYSSYSTAIALLQQSEHCYSTAIAVIALL
jgi:hypothetical protein